MKHLFLLVLLLAVLVRLPLLPGSFWLDEAAQALESARPLTQQLSLNGDFQPPLYHLLVFVLIQFSRQEWWLRLASLLPAVLTLYLTYRLAEKLFNRPVAFLSGFLLAVSPLHVFYSQELRPYSLSVLWLMLALNLLSAGLKTKPAKIALVLVNALGLLTVYTYIFALLAQLVFVITSKKIPYRSFLLSLVSSLFLCVWWLPSFWSQFRTGQALSQSLPGWRQTVSPAALKALPITFNQFTWGRIPVPDSGWPLPLTLIPIALSLFLIFQSFRQPPARPLAYALALTLSAAWLVTWFIPLLDSKRVLFLLPLWVMLLALAIMQFKPFWRYGIIIFYLSLHLSSFYRYWTNPDLQREPWRQAVAWVESQAAPATPVVFAFSGPFAPWSWYQTQDLPTLSPGYLAGSSEGDLDPRLINLLSSDQVIVFDYLMDLTDPDRLIYAWLDSAGFRPAQIGTFPNLGQIRVFNRRESFARIMN